MQNAAIAALGIDAVYVALRVPPDRLPAVLEACVAAGLSGNLTVPLKEVAAKLLPHLTPLARALGAANTFWVEDGVLRGDNTDVAGVARALRELDAPPPWLVCGTGGSARAVAAAALEAEMPIVIRSRDPARAARFADWVGSVAGPLGKPSAAVTVDDDGAAFGTVINATPVGLEGGNAGPLPEKRWRAARAALDLVYRPGETAWVRACRDAGLRAADGRGVLVEQGAQAFERFFAGAAAPREIMRAAVARALAL
jgi:shikimate dehydrogenase